MLKSTRMRTIAIGTALVSALGSSALCAQQDKYTLRLNGSGRCSVALHR